jgi:hypothetical protein
MHFRAGLMTVAVMAVPFCFESHPAVLGAEPKSETAGGDSNETDVAEIIRLLDQIAAWPLGPGEESLREAYRIEKVAPKIASYPLEVIRASMIRYHEKRGTDGDFKLLFLNRYLFNIPKSVRRDSPHLSRLVTCWSGMPHTGDSRNPADSDEFFVRWPWEEGEDGHWHFLVRQRVLTYMGPPYKFLEDFDYARDKFGRRQLGYGLDPLDVGPRSDGGLRVP